MKYFYDSYALIEFAKGNEDFLPYFADKDGVTSFYNLVEVYYAFIREYNVKTAAYVLSTFKSILVHETFDIIEPAMNFKKRNSKKKLSYVDCIGYAIAQKKKEFFSLEIKDSKACLA